MCLAQKFYYILVDALCDIGELDHGASLLHADRAISRRFGVSESTARNWRRCTNTVVSPAVALSVIAVCEKLAPARVPDLEFISRLSQGTLEIKMAADALVDELSEQVFTDRSTWSIYSGPLKMALDPSFDPVCQYEMMSRAGLVVERVLEMGIDRANIPSIGELIRYSTHGWWSKGFFRVRETALSSHMVGIRSDSVDPVEIALYIGDGCGGPCVYFGDTRRAMMYYGQALDLLDTISPAQAVSTSLDWQDAVIMIRSLQASTACYEGFELHEDLIEHFVADFGAKAASNAWIDSMRQGSLGYIELLKRRDFAKAAYHLGEASKRQDEWASGLGIPFSVTSQQSLYGYALLMTQGPTDRVRALLSEGLVKTIDYGAISDQISARLCQSLFHEREGEFGMARFHRRKAEAMAQQYNLGKWYGLLNTLFGPHNVQTLAS